MNYAVMAAGKTTNAVSNADAHNLRTDPKLVVNQDYTLNERDALSKKPNACDRDLPIRSEKKRGGHLFYMQPAYYENLKSLLVDTDFFYTAPSFSVDNFDEHQESTMSVEGAGPSEMGGWGSPTPPSH